MQDRLRSVVERLTRGAVRPAAGPPALVALDVGTEFAKALVVSITPDDEGRLVGSVRGSGRQRQGLTHMQSGTVSDIDAVVANCARALGEARGMAGLEATSAVIGIAGELVKGTTSNGAVRRDDPRAPMTEEELQRIVEQVQVEALADA
ncbi:MAG TPA: hypothetical protein VII26_06700, partial [Candidatus Limnocylindria bacterium]